MNLSQPSSTTSSTHSTVSDSDSDAGANTDLSPLAEQDSTDLAAGNASAGNASKVLADDQPLRSEPQQKLSHRTTADVLLTGGHISC